MKSTVVGPDTIVAQGRIVSKGMLNPLQVWPWPNKTSACTLWENRPRAHFDRARRGKKLTRVVKWYCNLLIFDQRSVRVLYYEPTSSYLGPLPHPEGQSASSHPEGQSEQLRPPMILTLFQGYIAVLGEKVTCHQRGLFAISGSCSSMGKMSSSNPSTSLT